jgi:preprotein translocase subunit SecF
MYFFFMFIIRHKTFFLSLGASLIALSFAAVLFFGFRFGIDFTGGSILEVEYTERPSIEQIESALAPLSLGAMQVQESGEQSVLLRTVTLTEEAHQSMLQALTIEGTQTLYQTRFSSVGPSVGSELKQKAILSLVVVLIVIILFVAFAFRKVSEPVRSWKYGLVAVMALVHDIMVPVGAFVVLGAFFMVEADILFVTALLAILGYSVNDTIVVFDRVRENLTRNSEEKRKEPFAETVGRSIEESFARSINTSLTTLLVLLALFILGGESTRYFSLTLLIGVIAGTYSSLFLASPLLVLLAGKKRT